MNKTYTEKWLYLPWVGTHKNPPKTGKDPESDLSTKVMTNRSTPKYSNKFYVGVKAFSFGELVDALRKGHSIKRIGPIGTANGTRYLVIDIDNDNNECITPEELDHFCNGRDNIEWTKGGSGRDFRYHIVVLLDHPIYTSSEVESETKAILIELTEDIGRDIEICPDPNQFKLLQWCYGVPQDCMERREIEGTELWCRQITKDNDYKIIQVNPADFKPKQKTDNGNTKEKPKMMPYNTAMLASMLADGKLYACKYEDGSYVRPMVCLEGTRFDCYEPHSANKTVRKGKRFDTAQAWMMRLVPQYYRCKSLGLSYSEGDVVFTFKSLCMRNFEDAQAWWEETGKSMVSGLTSELHSNDDLDYADIETKYKPSHATELYKRRGYGMATAMYILDNLASVSTDNGTVTFPSRSSLDEILANYHISYASFMAYMKDPIFNLKVVYEDDARQSHQHDYIWNAVKDTDNTYYYGDANESVKCFCKRHGIRYISMYKLFSGTKQQYRAIIESSREAYKAMCKYFDSLEESNVVEPSNKPIEIENDDWDIPDDLPFYAESPMEESSSDEFRVTIF